MSQTRQSADDQRLAAERELFERLHDADASDAERSAVRDELIADKNLSRRRDDEHDDAHSASLCRLQIACYDLEPAGGQRRRATRLRVCGRGRSKARAVYRATLFAILCIFSCSSLLNFP